MDDEITLNGHRYLVELANDRDAGPPWEEHDGHGEVSDWTYRRKHPGERVLATDRDCYRYYDVAATIQLAREDGWGIGPDHVAKLAHALGRTPTARELVACAVELDYEFLRGWCADEWHYVGVVVTEPDSEETESLWCVEDRDPCYVAEVAFELAADLEHRLGWAMPTRPPAPPRPGVLDITRAMLR